MHRVFTVEVPVERVVTRIVVATPTPTDTSPTPTPPLEPTRGPTTAPVFQGLGDLEDLTLDIDCATPEQIGYFFGLSQALGSLFDPSGPFMAALLPLDAFFREGVELDDESHALIVAAIPELTAFADDLLELEAPPGAEELDRSVKRLGLAMRALEPDLVRFAEALERPAGDESPIKLGDLAGAGRVMFTVLEIFEVMADVAVQLDEFCE